MGLTFFLLKKIGKTSQFRFFFQLDLTRLAFRQKLLVKNFVKRKKQFFFSVNVELTCNEIFGTCTFSTFFGSCFRPTATLKTAKRICGSIFYLLEIFFQKNWNFCTHVKNGIQIVLFQYSYILKLDKINRNNRKEKYVWYGRS